MVYGDPLVHLNDTCVTHFLACMSLKLECGIYRTDFDVSDKQNVNAVPRLISDNYYYALERLETPNLSISALNDKNVLEVRRNATSCIL